MAIAFDSAGSGAKATSDTGALSFNITVTAGLANSIVNVAIRLIGAPTQTLTSLTYNAVGQTFRSRNTSVSDNFNTVEHWYGLIPASGTITVVATPSAACRMIGWAQVHQGVNQGSPFSGSDSFANDAAPGTTITQTVSATANQLVMDAVAPSGGNTLTVGGGQTPRVNITPGDTIGGSEEAGAASTVMSWTISGTDNWFSLAWILNPALLAQVPMRNYRPAPFKPMR